MVLLAAVIIANLGGSDTPSVKARTAEVERGKVTASISAPGRVEAVASVDLSAEVPGRIVELRVAEGDSVSEGDLLLRLDDAQYKSRVEQAEAFLHSAEADLALAEARLEKASSDRDRSRALVEKNLASAEALEQAETDFRVQRADTEARRQELARRQAALADARDDLEKTVYRAPVSGIVSRLNVEQGEIVITGTMNNPGTVILSIADLTRMEVEAEVDETDVVYVRTGQRAEITVDALPDTTFEGTVAAVGNSGRRGGAASGNEVINFEVTVRFQDTDPRLKPGMTADVEVETRTRDGVLTVPIQSLVARSQGVVWKDRKEAAQRAKETEVKSPGDSLSTDAKDDWEKEVLEGVYKIVDDTAVFVPVQAGISDESRIEVSGDLAEGDKIVDGPYKVLRELKEGTRIEESKDGQENSES